jgi:hypothetical protein
MNSQLILERLDEIDNEMAYLEDQLKGSKADIATEVRGMIMDLVNDIIDQVYE